MQSAKHGIFDFRKCGTVLAPFNTPNIELWRDHQPLIPGEVGQVHVFVRVMVERILTRGRRGPHRTGQTIRE
jgi:hypothetical protein